MKCINFFKTGEEAKIRQQFLKENGISTRVMVDPLDSRYPALSDFGDVGLYVEEESHDQACALLMTNYKAA